MGIGGRAVATVKRALAAIAIAAAALSWSKANAEDATAARFQPLFDQLAVCQLLHLTPNGYLQVSPSGFFADAWTRDDVAALRRDARLRPTFQIDLRSTVHLQLSRASSYQASTAFAALAAFMADRGIDRVARAPLLAAGETAYRTRLAANGFEDCFMIKWGNRFPDLFAQPMRQATWRAIRALFESPASPHAAWPLAEIERAAIDDGALTREEIVELRGVRVAAYIFENEFAALKNDKGGFGGNLEDQPLVCTDEATTQWFFLNRLEEAGLLRHFATQDGRFVHRRPTLILPTDHFGVLLRNRRTGGYYALDSWVEDGGIPPHVASVDDWFDLRERRSVASLGDAELDAALLAEAVTHQDEGGLLTKLRAHLAPMTPDEQTPRVDGRPTLCRGFNWCGAPPLDGW